MLLELKNLMVSYKTREGRVLAVDKVSLPVEEKKTLGLVGESGCGKSTLGGAILGILPRETKITGKAIFNGTDLISMPSKELRFIRGKDISMIFQDPMTSLNPVMKLRDHFLETIFTHTKTSKEDAIAMAEQALKEVGISSNRLNDYPFQLSGGMRQRVMIALSLVLNPKLVIADEPTTSLDVIVQAQILQLLKGLQEKFKMAMILITHDLGVVAEAADDIGVMYGGHLVEYAPKFKLYKDPLHPYTKDLLASVPNTNIDDKELRFITGYPPYLMNPPQGCRYAERCSKAKEICKQKIPPDFYTDDGRLVKCWLYGEGEGK